MKTVRHIFRKTKSGSVYVATSSAKTNKEAVEKLLKEPVGGKRENPLREYLGPNHEYFAVRGDYLR